VEGNKQLDEAFSYHRETSTSTKYVHGTTKISLIETLLFVKSQNQSKI